MSNTMDIISDTYVILEKLGEGGGGVVYKAYHKRLKKEVVLKKLRRKSVNTQTNRQEVDILKNLNHMYLPQIIDFLDVNDEIYTVMSYISGKSFKNLLDEEQRFTQNELIAWCMQICSALNYLHSQKPPIIHGDIKPANIMLTADGHICLIDFNISFYLDDSVVLGYTYGYTSPEQYIIALDSKSAQSIPHHSVVDEKSDIYSVGATFYHLATGKKLESYQSADVELLIHNTSEAFAQIIMKAVQPDSDQRFENTYEMYKALQNVTKKDDRYQQLIKKQKLIRGGLVAALAGFILLAGYGVRTIKTEHVEYYNDLVEDQIALTEQGNYEESKEVHQEATEVLPAGIETYYQQAYALYLQQKYEDSIAFINYDIFQNEKLDLESSKMSDVLYLLAENYYKLEQYENSIKAYEALFEYGAYDCIYYRDYAIALAYAQQFEKAEAVLNEAIGYGLADDSVYYAQGEIEKAMGQYDSAITNFRNCIETTENNELTKRSYLMMSRIYEDNRMLEEQRDILREATEELPVPEQMIILEELVQANVDLADQTDQGRYREEAISDLNKIVKQGWDTYNTHNNLVILNQKQGHLDAAAQEIETMRTLYGDDYNIFKRYAFLEIEKQEQKSNYDRNYSKFKQYYDTAVQMYSSARNNGSSDDAEMNLLEQVYQQVRSGGWL